MDKVEQWKQMMKKKKLEAPQLNSTPVITTPDNISHAITELVVPMVPLTPFVPEMLPPSFSDKEREMLAQEDQKQKPKTPNREKARQAQQATANLQQVRQQNQKHIMQENMEGQKHNSRFVSQNISIAISKPSVDEGNQVDKQRVMKLSRFLLKDVDKLKQTVANIEGCLKGLEYIKRRMRGDRQFHRKIKDKINQIRDIFEQ